MKLAFSTLPCMNASAKELKEICDNFGFSGAEVRLNNDNTFTCGEGLNITNLGSSICIKKYDAKQLENAITLFKTAEEANIPAIRVFLGNFFRTYDTPREMINHLEIAKMLQALCDSSKTQVWIETHNEYATGKSLRKLLDDVNRESIKIIWDIIHPIEDGETPEETLRFIGKDIAHVHIKDGIKSNDKNQHDFIYTALGKGQLPIKRIINLLEGSGYNGYYSLEWESLWRNELKELNISNDELFKTYVELMNASSIN